MKFIIFIAVTTASECLMDFAHRVLDELLAQNINFCFRSLTNPFLVSAIVLVSFIHIPGKFSNPPYSSTSLARALNYVPPLVIPCKE